MGLIEITRKQLKTDCPFNSLPNRGDLEGQKFSELWQKETKVKLLDYMQHKKECH
jgi:hypothetical protein